MEYFGEAVAGRYDRSSAEMPDAALLERWADWDRTPFTAASAKHVSVWQLGDR